MDSIADALVALAICLAGIGVAIEVRSRPLGMPVWSVLIRKCRSDRAEALYVVVLNFR
jgi:hypothetical protein